MYKNTNMSTFCEAIDERTAVTIWPLVEKRLSHEAAAAKIEKSRLATIDSRG